MATDILTDEQRKAYGIFRGDPTLEQLTRYCYLTQTERVFIKERRGVPYLQLGFAVQLMTVRFLGTFLDDPLRMPESVVAFAAEQPVIDNWSDLQQYQADILALGVVLVSYSMLLPYLLLVYQGSLKNIQTIDLQKLNAYLKTVQGSPQALQEELDGRAMPRP